MTDNSKWHNLNSMNYLNCYFYYYIFWVVKIHIWPRLTYLMNYCFIYAGGRVSSVGIATGFGLNGPGIEIFPRLETGPGAHPAFCTMGTGSFQGQSGRGVVLSTHPLLAPSSRECRAIPLHPSGLSNLLRGTFTLIIMLIARLLR
jgi:hypothetical protein